MPSNIVLSWFSVYIVMLFLFRLLPSVSFLITAKNTIENKSLKIGIFTTLGIATSDCLFAIISFFLCFILSLNKIVFQYGQIIGMSYLLYFGIKTMLTKKETCSLSDVSGISRQITDAYKSGFLYTFSNLSDVIIIMSIISQFYNYANNWSLYLLLFFCVPVISFLTSMFISFSCYHFKLWWFFSGYSGMIERVVGFIIILLSITNIRSILSGV